MRFFLLEIGLVLTAFLPLGGLAFSAASGVSAGPSLDPIDIAGRSCTAAECHDTFTAREFVHAPVIQGDCEPCHVADPEGPGEGKVHALRTVPPTLELCGGCHRDLTVAWQVVHEPFTEKCTVCHDPHGGKVRYFLPKDTPGDLCLECHAEVTPPESRLHAPVALKECLECHGPHGSNREALLAREGNHVCVFCHIDFAERIENAVSVHEPVRGPCWDCHNPHAGTHAFFLSEDRPALCARCHSDIVGEGTPPLKYPHTVMTEGKACSACHDPHMAGFPRLLKRPSMDLCLGCHEGAVETADGRTLDEVGKRIEGSKFLHGPIRNKDCTPCHAAHGSDDPRLLTQAFPREFYAEYRGGMYALCWKCHDPDLVRAQETLATGFRNGRQNLHYVHVHLEKGRTCRACHHEHASNLPFHLRESVPFGEWELEIRFKQTSTGGMCLAGCHRPKAYDREKPVDNTPVGIPVGTPSSPRR